jgi:hypothetical protein
LVFLGLQINSKYGDVSTIAYILINCIPSEEKNVISKLSNLSEVVEVNGVLEKYDIFTKVVGNAPEDIDLVLSKIRRIKGITNTYTMEALYGQGGTIDKEPKMKPQCWIVDKLA